MTFEEIYQLKRNSFSDYSKLHIVIKESFEEALNQIQEADKKINPKKYEEIERKYQAAINGIYETKRSSGSYDPERDIMNAFENGEGDKFGF